MLFLHHPRPMESARTATVSMEFANEDELQAFLAAWLEDHGHSVYREVKCPDGGAIDILTQDYLIECKQFLTHSDLLAAAEQLRTYEQPFPNQQPVIAGLTPTSGSEEAERVADRLKTSGIEIWHVDQMQPFIDYYAQIGPERLFSDEPLPPPPPSRYRFLGGCFLALGVAGILAFSFWLAYQILDRNEARFVANARQRAEWDALHTAVGVWDLESAQATLDQMIESRDACTAEFATRLNNSLEARGTDGFRDINPIKRAMNQQEGCDLEMVPFDFSP